jgi:hypothetical protein
MGQQAINLARTVHSGSSVRKSGARTGLVYVFFNYSILVINFAYTFMRYLKTKTASR